MARHKTSEHRSALSPSEMALIERLVESGALIAVPQIGSAKPRRVVADWMRWKNRRSVSPKERSENALRYSLPRSPRGIPTSR